MFLSKKKDYISVTGCLLSTHMALESTPALQQNKGKIQDFFMNKTMQRKNIA